MSKAKEYPSLRDVYVDVEGTAALIVARVEEAKEAVDEVDSEVTALLARLKKADVLVQLGGIIQMHLTALEDLQMQVEARVVGMMQLAKGVQATAGILVKEEERDVGVRR